MGAIIGGAIGSVVGTTFSKKRKETRKDIVNAAKAQKIRHIVFQRLKTLSKEIK